MSATEKTVPAALRVLGCVVENFKRIELVELAPDGRTVVVGGNNNQGKSSLLDAIETVLRTPKRGEKIEIPLRKGARRGRVRLDLGELIAEMAVTAKGLELSVEQPPGVPVKKPRTVLDALGIDLSFDPLAFSRASDAEQGETLRRLSGCDTRPIDARRADLYARRTVVNADHRRAELRCDEVKVPPAPPAPAARESVAALLAERERIVAANAYGARARAEHERLAEDHGLAVAEVEEVTRLQSAHGAEVGGAKYSLAAAVRVGEIYREIVVVVRPPVVDRLLAAAEMAADQARAGIEAWLVEADEKTLALDEMHAEQEQKRAELHVAFTASAALAEKIPLDESTQPVDERLRTIEQHNAAVDAAQKLVDEHARLVVEQRKLAAEASRLASESKDLTDQIDQCDEEKAALLAAAKFPIAGLGFDGDLVLFDGLPFRQSSQSGKVRVGCAIAAALNPRLKIVLVRDGALLDDDSLRELIATLAALDVQPWIEVVGERDGIAGGGINVVLEDGRVKRRSEVAS